MLHATNIVLGWPRCCPSATNVPWNTRMAAMMPIRPQAGMPPTRVMPTETRKERTKVPQLQQSRITGSSAEFTQTRQSSSKIQRCLTLAEIDIELLNDEQQHPCCNMLLVENDRNEIVREHTRFNIGRKHQQPNPWHQNSNAGDGRRIGVGHEPCKTEPDRRLGGEKSPSVGFCRNQDGQEDDDNDATHPQNVI